MHGSAIYLRRASNTGYKTEKTKEKINKIKKIIKKFEIAL